MGKEGWKDECMAVVEVRMRVELWNNLRGKEEE